MPADLQRLVDALASRLDRAVVVEDRRQRMVAYSQHGGAIDAVRRESILQRETTAEVIGWLRSFGIAEAPDAVRIPGNDALDLLPRVCIPVRHDGLLLGFLWFIDADASMTDDEITVASDMAGDFALALYRENLVSEVAQRREAESVRNLLGEDAAAREHAAGELLADGVFLGAAQVVALVVVPGPGFEGEPERRRLALEQRLVQARRRVPPRHALHLVRFDHGVLLAATGAHVQTLEPAGHARALLSAGTETLVGVGDVVDGLADAHRSVEQARQAARVAARVPGIGPIAEWRELGVYRALAQLSGDQVNSAALHPGLSALLEVDEDQMLARTLETYLDLAGNAQATSQALQVHRATLYYRLDRISEIAGADLKDGADRLALHLGLKLARLDGRYRA